MSDTNGNTPAPAASEETTKLHSEIKAKFNNLVDVKETKFFFKTVTQEVEGVEVKNKRPTVELQLPVPSIEGIVAIFNNGGKGLELLQEVVSQTIIDRARDIVNDREDISQENFPLEELDWEKIANLPRAERRGGGIDKETWEEFGKDYVAVMPTVTGKKAEAIANAVKLLLAKFNPVKTNKPVLKLLKEQLALYTVNSPQAETYNDCIEFLMKKADTLLSQDDAALLANL